MKIFSKFFDLQNMVQILQRNVLVWTGLIFIFFFSPGKNRGPEVPAFLLIKFKYELRLIVYLFCSLKCASVKIKLLNFAFCFSCLVKKKINSPRN